jgi:hypothetical protein
MELGVRLSTSADSRLAVGDGLFALDRELAGGAELSVAVLATETLVLGGLQRGSDAPRGGELLRRVSGGALVRAAPGMVHVLLAL